MKVSVKPWQGLLAGWTLGCWGYSRIGIESTIAIVWLEGIAAGLSFWSVIHWIAYSIDDETPLLEFTFGERGPKTSGGISLVPKEEAKEEKRQ